MKITNKNNLPSAFVNLTEDSHPIIPKHYSVTTLLQPTREILLKRRHYDEIEQDVSDMVWLILGSAVHKIMENADKTGFAEMKLETNVCGDYSLTGICDLYNEELHTVEDYKTCSVWKVIHQDFSDWKKQGLMYAWLLRKKGLFVNKLRFHALMKDWSRSDLRISRYRNSFYPEHPIWTWEYEITEQDIKDIEEFINTKMQDIIANESKSDNELPICSEEERWNSGTKYAIIKPGNKRAIKVLDNKEEALKMALELDANVQERVGEDRKCIDYCLCKEYCNYWRKTNGIK